MPHAAARSDRLSISDKISNRGHHIERDSDSRYRYIRIGTERASISCVLFHACWRRHTNEFFMSSLSPAAYAVPER
jgi:hypothetical protein